MLNYVICQNFRKHENLRVHFTAGINAIRAANEAGKSTLLEAIAYALFGAAGLKEAVEDVVTYGVPASKLAVELGFTLAHVEYTISRSPKGAELSFGREKVTGQKEVTKFVEGLLGASQDMASKLMLAKQKNLGAALSGGATAAGKMIEDLAGLDLIEELRGLISEHLPSGNTASTEGMLSTLRGQAENVEQIDLEPFQEAVSRAGEVSRKSIADHKAKKAELDNLDLAAAREILTDEKLALATITASEKAAAAAQATIDLPALPAVKDGAIEALQAQIAAQEDLASAAKLHDQLKAAKVEMLWDEPLAALEAAIEAESTSVSVLASKISLHRDTLTKIRAARASAVSQFDMAHLGLESRLIKDTTCALCQKDLKDVPEVARINSPLSAQIEALKTECTAKLQGIDNDAAEEADLLAVAEESIAESSAHLKELNAVITRNRQLDLLYARAAKYIKLDESVVPALWTWTGPTSAPQNYSGELARLQEQHRAWLAREAQIQQAMISSAVAEESLASARERLAGLQLADARETLELEVALKPQVQALLEAAQRAEREFNTAKNAFELARQSNNQAATAAEQARISLTKAEATLAEMQANNALLKKLSGARPQITDKLWSIVLSSVSTYASDVRGEKSVITRDGGKFRINGNPVTGLSGSAEDVLGLAIRFALTKTFLGNVDFVILDEVAAACDDQRETAMLGLLATSGFAQTILVTHSELADSFADNIITL